MGFGALKQSNQWFSKQSWIYAFTTRAYHSNKCWEANNALSELHNHCGGSFSFICFAFHLRRARGGLKDTLGVKRWKELKDQKDPDGRPAIRRNTCIHTQNPHADLFPTVYNGRKNKSAINPRGWRWQRWKCINKYICIAQARNSLVDLLEF